MGVRPIVPTSREVERMSSHLEVGEGQEEEEEAKQEEKEEEGGGYEMISTRHYYNIKIERNKLIISQTQTGFY